MRIDAVRHARQLSASSILKRAVTSSHWRPVGSVGNHWSRRRQCGGQPTPNLRTAWTGSGQEQPLVAGSFPACRRFEKILAHLGLQARAPPRAPARGQALHAA